MHILAHKTNIIETVITKKYFNKAWKDDRQHKDRD